MPVEVRVPAVGESITEVQLGQWARKEGDLVQRDETLIELESEKATFDLPAPAAGKITKLRFDLGPAQYTAAEQKTAAERVARAKD